jgi:uncharacterized protein (TIGR02147 family)
MKPRIYNFTDYRLYLKEMFLFFKTQKISMRKIALQVGVSNAYLTMVLKRKRNLDIKYLNNFSDFFELNISEWSYFNNLIAISDNEDSRERSEAYKKLGKFRSYKDSNEKDVITHKYLNNWYYVAIRELSFSVGFKDDPAWIQEKFLPKLKVRDIENALIFLKKHNLLANHESSHFNCSEGIYKLSLTHFHQDMLKIIGESIPKVDRNDRSILGFTKSLNKANFNKAKDIMQRALKELEELESGENNTELYHFYLIGSPLTSDKEKNEED